MPRTYRRLTLAEGLRAAAARAPAKIALYAEQESLRFDTLIERIDRIANAASHDLGLGVGDHVTLLAPNCIEYVELVVGLAAAGCAVVTANPHLSETELRAIYADSDSKALFAHYSVADFARDLSIERSDRTFVIGENYENWRQRGADKMAAVAFDETQHFAISYTSGTTGQPKGVMLSHRSRVLTFLAMATEYGCYGQTDRALCPAPLFHGAGFAFALAPIFLGGSARILTKFDPEQTLKTLADYAATNVFMVPTHFQGMFSLPPQSLARYPTPDLKTIISNAAALPQTAKEQIVEHFGEGLLFECYGSTEAGIVSNLHPADQLRKTQCVGQPFPFTEIQILDNTGQPVSANTIGEVCSRSPYLFNGYWGQPDATAETLRGEWFCAGDLGRLDEDGHLYLEGRSKDMIISGGVNIYPREIEECLQQHPAVTDAAVVGAQDDYWGEAVTAFVVTGEAPPTRDELEAFCTATLSKFKLPKDYRFVEAIPKNASGKVLKRLLRAQLDPPGQAG